MGCMPILPAFFRHFYQWTKAIGSHGSSYPHGPSATSNSTNRKHDGPTRTEPSSGHGGANAVPSNKEDPFAMGPYMELSELNPSNRSDAGVLTAGQGGRPGSGFRPDL